MEYLPATQPTELTVMPGDNKAATCPALPNKKTMKKSTITTLAALLITLATIIFLANTIGGRVTPQDFATELQQEFNTQYLKILDTTQTPTQNFTGAGDEPLNRQTIHDGTYSFQHTRGCGINNRQEKLYQISDFVATELDITLEEAEAKSQAMRQMWEAQGLQVHNQIARPGMFDIMTHTESGLSLRYMVSQNFEGIAISSKCSADIRNSSLYKNSPSPSPSSP